MTVEYVQTVPTLIHPVFIYCTHDSRQLGVQDHRLSRHITGPLHR